MQPRSSLVNRQLFNKYFHSHHYYLGGRPKIARGRGMRGGGKGEAGSNGYDYTNIHVRADPYFNFIYPRFLRCSGLLFFFLDTIEITVRTKVCDLYYCPGFKKLLQLCAHNPK